MGEFISQSDHAAFRAPQQEARLGFVAQTEASFRAEPGLMAPGVDYNPHLTVPTGEQREGIGQNRYGLVILDFHGTKTDHQLRTVKSYHRTAQTILGEKLPKQFYQEALTRPSHASGQGETNQAFIRRKFEGHDDPTLRALIKEFNTNMKDVYIPIPNIIRTIHELEAEGVDVALFTNGEDRQSVENVLRRWRLPELAESFYSSHTTGVKKPDIRTVEIIQEDYSKRGRNHNKDKIVMVGDYKDDMRTAHAAGVDSILLTRGNGQQKMRLQEPKPTYVITNPLDIVKIAKGQFHQELGDEIEVAPVLWTREQWGPRDWDSVNRSKSSS